MIGLPEALIAIAVILAIAIVWSARILTRPRTQNPDDFLMWSIGGVPRPDLSPDTNPVQPTGIPVRADTELVPGDPVLISWQDLWLRGEIVSIGPGDRVLVHYIGWESTWDESVPRKRLQLPE
jgi:hypothetical protein